MATKPLIDITFPQIGNTYTFIQGDNSLTTAGAAADAKKTGDEITDLKEALTTKAEVNGNYQDMVVGNAEQLVSTISETDKVPYNFRTAGGSLEIGDREYPMLVGGSVVWNQLVKNGDFSNGTSGWVGRHVTVSATGGVCTATVTSEGTQRGLLADTTASAGAYIATHKILFGIDVLSPITGTVELSYGGGNGAKVPVTANTWVRCETLWQIDDTSYAMRLAAYITQSIPAGAEIKYKNAVSYDLTAMFGSTIADYIYTLEQATAGSGISKLRSWGFFTKPYYHYCAPTLEHTVTDEHKMVGFNVWDELTEEGTWDPSTGEAVTNTNQRRNKNPIKVLPGTAYDTNKVLFRYYYDADMHFVSYDGNGANAFTTPANVYYMNIRQTKADWDGKNTNIGLKWDGERDGEYAPYTEYKYPIDPVVIRGIPKLTDRELYYDGDIYEDDGTVTRKYGIVDLGTLTWSATSAERMGSSSLSSVIAKPEANTVGNIRCAAYVADANNNVYNHAKDKSIAVHPNGDVMVYDSAYTDAATFKAAMNGVMFMYELATVTTEEAEPFQSPQTVDNWGTEEYSDYAYKEGDRDFEMPVGHETKYPVALREKLESVPNNPSSDGVYLLHYENGVATYTPFASDATITDILARLTALEG